MPSPKVILKKRLAAKQDRILTWTGKVGYGDGTVDVSGRPGYVYVRVDGQSVPEEVYNDSVPVANDLPVILGIDPTQPNVKRILRARFLIGQSGFVLPTQIAAARFRWMADGGGQDPLYVELRQFMPLRPGPTTGMELQVARGFIKTPTGFLLVDTATIDLTAHIPATAGKAAWVLITINTSGALVGTKGSEVDLASLALTDLPAIPASTAMPVAAVRVYNTQTAIQEARSNTDLIDLRGATVSLTNGDVVGPASATDGNLAVFDGTTGKLLKDGGPVPDGFNEGNILLTSHTGGTVEFPFTADGFNDAIAAVTSGAGDVIHLPAGTLTGIFTLHGDTYTVTGQGWEDNSLECGTIIDGGLVGTNEGGSLFLENLMVISQVDDPGTDDVALDATGCTAKNCAFYAFHYDLTGKHAYAVINAASFVHWNCTFYAEEDAGAVNPFGPNSFAAPKGGKGYGSWFAPDYYDDIDFANMYFAGDRASFDVEHKPTHHATDIFNSAFKYHLPAPAAAGKVPMDNGTNWVAVQTYSTADVSNPPTAAQLATAFGTVPAGFRGFVNDAGGSSNGWLCVWDGTNWWYTAMTKAS